MKKFFVFENKDAGRAFVDALEGAGYERVKKLDKADFILYDIESVGRRRQMRADFITNRGPAFIYPHTPNTCYIWDGIYEPLPVAVNFVAGEGAKKCMQAYGYPYRIETCGFPRCEVLPFQFSKPRNLLFVPARPRRDKGRQNDLDLKALYWVIEHYREYFDSVTICRLEGQFKELDYMAVEINKMNVLTTNPKSTTSPAQDMIDRIDNADLVIAQHTPAALAVARGKPTIMYGQGESLENLQGHKAVNYPKYKAIYDYPLDLFQMDIQEVLNFAFFGCRKVEQWKQAHIGGNFDADKFLSIVREYL